MIEKFDSRNFLKKITIMALFTTGFSSRYTQSSNEYMIAHHLKKLLEWMEDH